MGPDPKRYMINFNATLGQNFLQISKGNRVPKIEEYRVQNEMLWKMAAFERDHIEYTFK